MKYLSVCSGIEAATVAWHPLGWQAAAFSEIEPFPSAVLAHHYPTVPNLGDMTQFKEWPDATVDVLVGGTPCQSFSVAGLRKGLDDPRGNLMLTFGAIAARYRPSWLVWENVPGVLSSNRGRDFGTFLGMLAQLGYGFAYRVLDAQYFGVPQRRRRVFVVGYLRNWRVAAAVLFERQSLSWNLASSQKTQAKDAGFTLSGVDIRNLTITGNIAHCAQAGHNAPDPGGTPHILSFHPTQTPISSTNGTTHAISCGSKSGLATVAVAYGTQLRRVTPLEEERLQGFPDGYTNIPWRGKPKSPDSLRYKALGNSMAVPVMRWIGERIDTCYKLLQI